MKPCRFYNSKNGCPKGDQCPFLHQKMKPRRCRFFSSPEGCPYGLNCSFNHEAVLLEKKKKQNEDRNENKKPLTTEIKETNFFCPVCKKTFENWEEIKTHFEETAHLGAHCTLCGKCFYTIHFRNIHEKETSHDKYKGVLVQTSHLKEVPKEMIKKLKKFSNSPKDFIEGFYYGYELNVIDISESLVVDCLFYFLKENVFKGVVKILGIKLLLFLEESKKELKEHQKIVWLIQESLKQNQDLQFIYQMIHLYKLDSKELLKDLSGYKLLKIDLKLLDAKLDEEISKINKQTPHGEVTKLIESLYEQGNPTEEMFNKRIEAFKKVEKIVTDIWNDADCQMFGSTVYHIFTEESDVDVCVSVPNRYLLSDKHALMEIKKKLFQHGILDSSLVLKTRVPVLSFVLDDVKFDVVANQEINLKKTQLVVQYVQLDHRVAPLLFALKKWKKTVEEKFLTNEVLISDDGSLNLNYHISRGLSFFCLTLMLIFFLQNRPVKILPNLQSKLMNEGDEMLEDNTESIGELLLAFFKEFSYFGYSSFVISIRSGKLLDRNESNLKNHSICVEDPFEIDINTARHIEKKKLVIEFKKAYINLCNGKI